MKPTVLDVCCGSRMFWFDKSDPRALYVDNRKEHHSIDIGTPGTRGRKPIVVRPDYLASFTHLPFKDSSFDLVVFDPPHIQREKAKGIFTRKYGFLSGDWQQQIHRGFTECFRVLRSTGTLIFKWSEAEYPLSKVLELARCRSG